MKKWLSLVLAMVMVLSLFPVATAESNDILTVKIRGVDYAESASNTTLHLSDLIEMNSPVYQAFCKVMEKHGVRVEFDLIPEDQYEVVCQTSLTKGLDCDWFNITPLDSQTRQQLVDRGMLRSFNDVVELSSGNAKTFLYETYGSNVLKMFSLEDGNCYWVPAVKYGHLGEEAGGSYMSMIVRQDWLTALNMEMPKTAEEFKSMLIAFQENDMNGNGEKDEVLSINFSSFANGVAQWFGIGTDLVYLDMLTGEIRTPWYSENVKAYIDYMKDLIDCGLVDTSNQTDQKMIENKVSATYQWSAEGWLESSVQVQDGAAAAYYVPMVINAVDGVDAYLSLQTTPTYPNYHFAMVANEGNEEALARLLDAIYDEELWGIGYRNESEVVVDGVTYPAYNCIGLGFNENNERIWIPCDQLSEKEAAVGRAMHLGLWDKNGCLPYFQSVDRNAEIANTIASGYTNGYPETGWAEKGEVFRSFFSYKTTTPYSIDSVMPAFTADETETIEAVETDLKTYSEELITKLVLGQSSTEDWNNYMSALEQLGLKEYVETYQICFNRSK